MNCNLLITQMTIINWTVATDVTKGGWKIFDDDYSAHCSNSKNKLAK